MIISASRRTDIPAFYGDWFINRIREGFCTVPNPFSSRQVAYVSLKPTDVDAIVFWTRNPKPFIKHLTELDDYGFRYYFQFTILANPRLLDPKTPPVEESIRTFRTLSERIGPERVIWRYDPIVLSDQTNSDFHREKFSLIASELKGYTRRAVISILDIYKFLKARMRHLESCGLHLLSIDNVELAGLAISLVEIATLQGMTLLSCAEDIDLQSFGVKSGKCVDDQLIAQLFGLKTTQKKDPYQRKACRCVLSKDIGMYDTCPFNCIYCYATKSFRVVELNRTLHDPKSPSLIGWHESTPVKTTKRDSQLKLL